MQRERQPTTHELERDIEARILAIASEYGPKTMVEITERIQAALQSERKLRPGEIAEILETHRSRSEFQLHAIEWMREQGFITQVLEDGTLVVDDQLLFKNFDRKTATNDSTKFDGFSAFTGNRMDFLGNTFAHKNVVLRAHLDKYTSAQADEKNIYAKPLFYSPESLEDALDIDKIQNAEFHYGLWEFPRITVDRRPGIQPGTRAVSLQQPGMETFGSFFEVSLAAMIYHPKFGAGKRVDGVLQVNNNTRQGKITGEWLEQQGFKFSIHGKPGAISTNARTMIAKYAPNIVERGLINLAHDFAYDHYKSRTAETQEVKGGTISLNGIKHFLGNDLNGQNVRVDLLTENLGVVVTLDDAGQGKAIKTFRVFSDRHDPELTNAYAGLSKTQTEEIDDWSARNHETYEHYAHALALDNAMRQQTDLKLSQLSSSLQQEMFTHGKHIAEHQSECLRFVTTFGQTGLEIVATCASDISILMAVIKKLFAMPEDKQQLFIEPLKNALHLRQKTLSEIKDRLTDGSLDEDSYRAAHFELNDLVSSLLSATEDITLVTRRSQIDTTARARNKMEIIGLFYRNAVQGRETIDPQDLPGLHFEILTGPEIDKHTRAQMLRIIVDNWGSQETPKLLAYQESLFNKTLQQPETTYHILKKDNRIIAFIRFDEQKDGSVYAGSLNIAPGAHQAKIGETAMKSVIDAEAGKRLVYAHVLAQADIGTKYVERFGDVIVGVDTLTVDDIEYPLLRLLRDDSVREEYKKTPLQNLITETVDIQNGVHELINLVKRMTARGLVATSYTNSPRPGTRTLIFQANKSVLG